MQLATNKAPSPAVLDAINRQVGAVENHLGNHFPWFRDDIRQEAWLTCLKNAHRFNPEAPGAKGFFYYVATLAVSERVGQWLTPLTIGRRAAQLGAAKTITRVGPEKLERLGTCACAEDILVAREQREEDRRDLLRQLAILRGRWRVHVERALADLPEKTAQVGALMLGLDGAPCTVGAAAREVGMWREKVEAALRECKRALKKRPQVAVLAAQIDELEAAINNEDPDEAQ